MGNKTCNTCEWFVEETETIVDFSHRYAKEQGRGFCLIKDLFTMQDSTDKACKGYQEESKAE